MKNLTVGQTVTARGRDWTVAIVPEADGELLVADPHLREGERDSISRADAICNSAGGKRHMLSGVYVQRDVLELSELS